MNIQEAININLIEELGLNALPEEDREKVLDKMDKIIHRRIIKRVLQELNESQQEKLDKLVEENPEGGEEIMEFLREEISNFDKLIGEEVASFKEEAKGFIDNITEQ